MITGGHNAEMRFCESTTDKLTSQDLDWKWLYTWRKEELIGASWPDNHQTLHFLRQEDGRLFLAGARAEGTIEGYFGDDYVDLYEVGLNGSTIELTHRSTRHMISHPTGEGIIEAIVDEVAAATTMEAPGSWVRSCSTRARAARGGRAPDQQPQ